MAKLLTPRSRTIFSLVLLGCALLVLIGIFLPKAAPPIWPAWAESAGMAMIMVAISALIVLAVFFQHSSPSAIDLIEAARKRLKQENAVLDEWEFLQVKLYLIKQLSRKEKLSHWLLIFFGIAFSVYGVIDIFGFGPPPYKLWSYAEGRYIPMPTWLSGILAITSGMICYLMSFILRTKVVDRWDEDLKKLLNGGYS